MGSVSWGIAPYFSAVERLLSELRLTHVIPHVSREFSRPFSHAKMRAKRMWFSLAPEVRFASHHMRGPWQLQPVAICDPNTYSQQHQLHGLRFGKQTFLQKVNKYHQQVTVPHHFSGKSWEVFVRWNFRRSPQTWRPKPIDCFNGPTTILLGRSHSPLEAAVLARRNSWAHLWLNLFTSKNTMCLSSARIADLVQWRNIATHS